MESWCVPRGRSASVSETEYSTTSLRALPVNACSGRSRYSVQRPPVTLSARERVSHCLPAILLATCLLFAACGRGRSKVLEVDYVSAPLVNLRDRLAAVYNKTGVVKNGDRVEVLERQRRFLRVRAANGAEGWIEQRYVVGQEVYDGFQKLTQDNLNTPVQANATTRNDTNLHIEPGRDTEHLYQLAAGEKLAMLKRGTAEKPGASSPPPKIQKSPDKAEAPQPILEDWWLARDGQGRVGWVLGRLVDLDVPLEIAQYAEGQRLVAFFTLNQVQDGDKKVSEYLAVLTEPKDGQPFDFDQVRVFTWNLRKHRYETAYRERNFEGFLPVTVSHENFGKEGTLPVFVLRVKDTSGNMIERKYKLNTPIVRRVLAPGEQKETPVARRNKKRR